MLSKRTVKKVAVQKVSRDIFGLYRDVLAVEEPLEIRLEFLKDGYHLEKSISITMRTPGSDFELASGFFLSEGIVRRCEDIEQISYCVGLEKERQQYNVIVVRLRARVEFDLNRLLRNFYTTSSCGVCGKASLDALQIASPPAIPKGQPLFDGHLTCQMAKKLRSSQSIFEKTGGLHAAALFDDAGNLIGLYEDVGRHNAVDKLTGSQLLANKLPLSDHLMLVSGRASFEIIQKALMAGIPIVAAVGAPSSLAVDLANQFGMTLLGFVRDESFNIYTGFDRIRFKKP